MTNELKRTKNNRNNRQFNTPKQPENGSFQKLRKANKIKGFQLCTPRAIRDASLLRQNRVSNSPKKDLDFMTKDSSKNNYPIVLLKDINNINHSLFNINNNQDKTIVNLGNNDNNKYLRLIEEELKLEEEMLEGGIQRFRKNNQKDIEAGRSADTASGQAFVSQCVNAVAEGIEEFIADAGSGKAGKRHSAVKYFTEFKLDPYTCAYLALRCVFTSHSSDTVSIFQSTRPIGKLIEDEARFAKFKKEYPGYFKTVLADMAKRTKHEAHKRNTMAVKMKHLGVDWEPWGDMVHLKIGQKLLDIVIAKTGRVQVVQTTKFVKGKLRTDSRLALTPETVEWLDKREGFLETVTPLLQPMIVEPEPWTGPLKGGYLSERIRQQPFAKTRAKAHMVTLRKQWQHLKPHVEAVNAIQRTPWQINKQILDVLEKCCSRNITLGVLPEREPIEIPPKPLDWETNKEAFVNWKHKATDIHSRWEPSRQGKCRKVDSILITAKKYAKYDEIFFPYNCDFRGRIYALPQFLNPQGEDLAKGLLTFAKGRAIETNEQANWLAIHGANVFGFDKAPMIERSAWIDEHEDEIIASAEDPIQNRFWTTADRKHRWQALAFCFEWSAFREHGFGYESHLPIYVDGSCNGLQHYSAMLRDEVGGAAVNLTPSEKPSDIYGLVADVATKHLQQIANGKCFIKSKKIIKPEQTALAKIWLDFGLNRSICKRSVMTLPYGSTMFSCKDFIFEEVESMVHESGVPFATDLRPACNFLGEIVWKAIGEVVVKAREGMECLQALAAAVGKEGLPLSWVTPSGFPVFQAYKDIRSRQIRTVLGGKTYRPRYNEELDSINSRKQASGIAPNFVHSLDSAALALTVNSASQQGVGSFWMIHDAFGCHAADMPKMARVLRETFLEMYQEDVFENFIHRASKVLPIEALVELPDTPPRGSLNLKQVLESEHFFG